ncbi:MAG: glycoside hydrolase N-terminal domain-containing protein [Gemmatimonadetes bacterium]|nr:glycoside hydrolase N-terminal domain-containing protein [Gemmatimonadota bacterium]
MSRHAVVVCAILLVLLLPAHGAAQDARSGLRLQAPITTWDEAIPVGNGLLGGLLWGGDSTLILSLDRGDLWDERTPAIFSDPEWTWQGMQRLVRDDNMARFHELFDEPYDKLPYPTKLPAGRVQITWSGHVVDGFGLDLATATAWASAGRDTLRLRALATRDALVVSAPGTLRFAYEAPDGLAALGPTGPPRLRRIVEPGGETAAELVTIPTAADPFSVHVTRVGRAGRPVLVISIFPGTEPPPVPRQQFSTASEIGLHGLESMLKPHRKAWDRFWSTSSVTLPDSALQAHYDLVKYLYGAAARRDAPPMPLQGVWTADNGGLPPWKGDYHNDLNTQMSYLAAHVAGLDDAMEGWLTFLEARLPEFRRFAREFYGVEGAAIPGVMTLSGKPMGGWGMYSLSPTNGAWVAWSFYRQWQVTRDSTFLAERAYPFMQEIGTALRALLERGEDGLLYLPLSSSPEIHDNSRAAFLRPNSTYDATLLRMCFAALGEMAAALGRDAESAAWYAAMQEVATPSRDPESGALRVSADEGFSASHRHFSHALAIHPFEMPLLLTGDIDATLDEIAARGTAQWTGYSFSWFAAMLARAGRGDEALRYLTDYLAFTSRNGFHLNGDQSGRGLSSFTYRPFTLEGNFLAMDAVHEMLLRSDGEVVELFPAIPTIWDDVAFARLRANGGWTISATREGGVVTAVEIATRVGGTLRLRDPFGGRDVRWRGAAVRRAGEYWVAALQPNTTMRTTGPR